MSDQPSDRKQNRDRALALYDQARALEQQGDYHAARVRYEESLRLHEDAAVRAAYSKLLATIGPK